MTYAICYVWSFIDLQVHLLLPFIWKKMLSLSPLLDYILHKKIVVVHVLMTTPMISQSEKIYFSSAIHLSIHPYSGLGSIQ